MLKYNNIIIFEREEVSMYFRNVYLRVIGWLLFYLYGCFGGGGYGIGLS